MTIVCKTRLCISVLTLIYFYFSSGHGLSGMAFLAVPSLVATPAMFGGAILTGCLMKYGLSVPDLPPVDINALNI